MIIKIKSTCHQWLFASGFAITCIFLKEKNADCQLHDRPCHNLTFFANIWRTTVRGVNYLSEATHRIVKSPLVMSDQDYKQLSSLAQHCTSELLCTSPKHWARQIWFTLYLSPQHSPAVLKWWGNGRISHPVPSPVAIISGNGRRKEGRGLLQGANSGTPWWKVQITSEPLGHPTSQDVSQELLKLNWCDVNETQAH